MTTTSPDSPRLPPLAAVARVLRGTTEYLARELAAPRGTPPGWSEFEWRTARAVAAMHGISGVLAEDLPWRGPDGWAEFLSGQREHIARRQARIRELLGAVDERFGRQGIPVQVLKGAALHLGGTLTQGRRIVRALRSRTPRPWPLYNVRAALAEPR
jgi:Uncharacterised nucleotidyltransferase